MICTESCMRRATTIAASLALLLTGTAQADTMDGRLAEQANRTSQCATWDWGYPCGWVNVEAYAPVIYRTWSQGSWGPLDVHNPDTGDVVQNMTNVAIPDYAAQGPWRSTERPEASDLGAVFIDYTHPQARVCETWNFDWKWWTGPTARHGGCMDYTPGESARAFPWPMGSQASGLRYIDGVITVSEWRRWIDHGVVPNHELQVAVPLACRSFREPANRSDGGNWAEPDNSDCIQYGTLYKLPADYQPGFIWSSFVRLAIEMAKENGIRVSDQTGYSVVVRVENPGRLYPDKRVDGWDDTTAPYPEFDWETSAGRDNRLMRQFPWAALTVVN